MLWALALHTVASAHLTPMQAARPVVCGSSASVSLQRLRGGAEAKAVVAPDAAAVNTARALILLSGAIYGTYPVLIRALQFVDGEPLPAAFLTFARYQFLMAMAFALKGWRALQGTKATAPVAQTKREAPSPWGAALELAALTVITTILSVWGVGRISAVTSEILASTVHVFVPLQTLVMVGGASFGRNTWLGYILAFVAAVVSCLADSAGAASGAGGTDWLGNGAVVLSTFIFGVLRVRTQLHLRTHDSETLNTSRMVCMGLLSCVTLLIDVASGGESRTTLGRLGHIVPMQWLLIALGVFLSAFVASSLAFAALKTISAANAQPFSALQPLFAAGWSMLLLSEPITRGALIGGGMMIGATLLACTDNAAAKPKVK